MEMMVSGSAGAGVGALSPMGKVLWTVLPDSPKCTADLSWP